MKNTYDRKFCLRLESRKAQISETHPDLSINRQLQLLQVPRSSFYYRSHRGIGRVASAEQARDEIMEIYLDSPFYGVPRLTAGNEGAVEYGALRESVRTASMAEATAKPPASNC